MDIELVKQLKANGESLSIFVFNLLNNDKENPLHELYKEEEPKSITELCDELRNYALSLTFSYPNMPKLSAEQDSLVSKTIQQLDQVVGAFNDKYSKNEQAQTKEDLTQDLRLLATFFATKHLIIDSYYNHFLQQEQKSPEPIRAKL